MSLQDKCHLFSNISAWTFVAEFLTGKHRGKNSGTIAKRREGNAAGDEKCEKYTGQLVLERRIEIRDHNVKYFHNLVTCLLLGRTPINWASLSKCTCSMNYNINNDKGRQWNGGFEFMSPKAESSVSLCDITRRNRGDSTKIFFPGCLSLCISWIKTLFLYSRLLILRQQKEIQYSLCSTKQHTQARARARAHTHTHTHTHTTPACAERRKYKSTHY